MNRFITFIPFALLFGCSSAETTSADKTPSAPDAVFAAEPRGGADAAEVTGIWETAEPTKAGPLESTLRFELRADHVIAAARCTTNDGSADPVVAGARVNGTVTEDSIALSQKVDATKQIGNIGICGVRVAQGALPRCTETDAEKRKSCFALENGSLTLYQASGPRAFVKIAD